MKAYVTIIGNTSTGLFHVIYFRHSPLPSEDMNPSVIRLKSGGHRTTGQPLDEAKQEVTKLGKALNDQGYWVLSKDEPELEWDGTDVPASVILCDPRDWHQAVTS